MAAGASSSAVGVMTNKQLTAVVLDLGKMVAGIHGFLGLRGDARRAMAADALQWPQHYSTAGTVHGYGCEGERELAAGRLPTAGQEGRDFLLNSCLIRLIHLLSLYREV